MSHSHPANLSEVYAQHHNTGERRGQSFMEDTRAELFRSWIGQEKAILDLGGRDGTLTRHFMTGNTVVIGDIDTHALEDARANYGVDTAQVDLNARLPFDDAAYDVVVLAEVLEHLPYPQITLAEIQRVLKPSGVLIGSIPLAYHIKDRWQVLRGKKLWVDGDPTHVQFFRHDDLIDFFNRFLVVESVVPLKGGRKAHWFPKLFARDVAFRCRKAA